MPRPDDARADDRFPALIRARSQQMAGDIQCLAPLSDAPGLAAGGGEGEILQTCVHNRSERGRLKRVVRGRENATFLFLAK